MEKFLTLAFLSAFVVMGTALKEAQASSPRADAFSIKTEADQLLKKGSLAESVRKYNEALTLNPQYANAFYNRAIAYYLIGSLEKASSSLEKFLALTPGDAEAHYNLGCLMLRLEDLESAKFHFSKASCCPCIAPLKRKIGKALNFVEDLENEGAGVRTLILHFLRAGIEIG